VTISRFVRFRGGPTPPTSPGQDPNPGIEIVRHLAAELPGLGIPVLSTEDVEYAHQIRCEVDGKSYELMVGYDWVAGDWWEVFYAPRLPWWKRILGQSEEGEMRALTSALATALGRLPGVGEMRWYEAYGAGVRASYSATPEY
jgi:hypothetical protein